MVGRTTRRGFVLSFASKEVNGRNSVRTELSAMLSSAARGGRRAKPLVSGYAVWMTRSTRMFWTETWAATWLATESNAWAAGASGTAATIG